MSSPSPSSPPSATTAPCKSRLLSSASPGPAILSRREASFSGNLNIEDRRRLRAIVLKTHRYALPFAPTTSEIDAIIDAIGPEVARSMVLEQLAAGKVG